MTERARYAIYFVPPPASDLAGFGASVLGHDVERGDEAGFDPALAAAFADWPALTAEPRRYGFHATLKAPFRLAAGTGEQALADAADVFAGQHSPVAEFDLSVRRVGRFVALVPASANRPLHALGDACVREFDRFRAPLTDAERARRHASALDPALAAHLERWGYPYVFDAFRFHMTLTGPLAPEIAIPVAALLAERFGERVPAQRVAVDTIVLCRQGSAADRFRVIGRWKLGGSAGASAPLSGS